MIKIGIIGCGKIAQVRHIPEYLENKNVCLAGFYDLNLDRAKKLAEQYDAKAYNSYEELLADEEIEAVSVCAANIVHAEITIAALNAGKHVLCEKPMATTLEDCEAMVEAAKINKKYLMIDQNQRLAKAHIEAKKMIEEGVIGDIITFVRHSGMVDRRHGVSIQGRTHGFSIVKKQLWVRWLILVFIRQI